MADGAEPEKPPAGQSVLTPADAPPPPGWANGGIHGLICDLDGVLVSSEATHECAWHDLVRSLGFAWPDAWPANGVGVADHDKARDLVARFGLGLTAAELLAMKNTRYQALAAKGMQTFPDLPGALLAIGQRLLWPPDANRSRLAVCTSATRGDAHASLSAVGLLARFIGMICAEDVRHLKPHPDPYQRAAALLDLPPSACAVLEDSPTGLCAARAAGCLCLGVATTHAPAALRRHAHLIFAHPAAALTWLLASPLLG
jgi:beta-phosphoglucomutase